VHDSFVALRVDSIDLYYPHRADGVDDIRPALQVSGEDLWNRVSEFDWKGRTMHELDPITLPTWR